MSRYQTNGQPNPALQEKYQLPTGPVRVIYGFDKQLSTYFLEAHTPGEQTNEESFIDLEHFARSLTNGKMLEEMQTWGVDAPKEHTNLIALDLPF